MAVLTDPNKIEAGICGCGVYLTLIRMVMALRTAMMAVLTDPDKVASRHLRLRRSRHRYG